jgi:hypothetical protein
LKVKVKTKTWGVGRVFSVVILALLFACTGDGAKDAADTAPDTGASTDLPTRYAFDARDGSGSSVSYGGQMFRHLLIDEMTTHLEALTGRLDAGYFPERGDVAAELDFYYHFDSATSGTVPFAWTSDPAPLQAVFDDVSSGKDLAGKIAGNDPANQHVDWATAFVGWRAEGVSTPESLVVHWFDELDAAAVAWSNGDVARTPDGRPVPAVYVTAEGIDLRELLQKFLTGAVAFSQGADDYLDEGLDEDHAALVEGAPYTALEHAWDEGFGYFGAARDYPAWADATVASPGYADTFAPDGAIDLTSEVCWAHARYAAKRDLGASADAPTDFTATAWEGFARGRALLASTTGPLTAAQRAELEGHRDQAVAAWEGAIAASVVHYLNEVLVVLSSPPGAAYDFGEYAAAWSEMKGFALALQFNPRSPVSDADFSALHALLGQAPVLPGADAAAVAAYAAQLREARALLGEAYGFDAANLGGADGTGGW